VLGGDVCSWDAEEAGSMAEHGTSLQLVSTYGVILVERDPSPLGGERDPIWVTRSLAELFAVVLTHSR
jgi:hypothetical protein